MLAATFLQSDAQEPAHGMIQAAGLQEVDFRSERLRNHPHDLKGNNDLLCLTRPDVIEAIHSAYFGAGADIVETNTFNSTAISQSDYHTESLVPEINAAAVALARRAARKAEEATPGRRCFVAGAIGPLNRTLSLSPDVNRPDFRAVTWDQVVAAYTEQARSLMLAEPTRDIPLEDIAKSLNISYTSFRRTFREHTGASPHQYRLHLKISAARELLRSTDLRVKEISYRCGFDDEQYFCRIFKRQTGNTPIEFRARSRRSKKPGFP